MANLEVTTIIFSKNRACQLELLLRSLNIPATVLYTYDPEFKAGYDKLIGMYPDVKFLKETNFKEQLLELIGEYTLFLVDDDVMLEPFYENCPEFIEFKRNPDIICLNLRMSTRYCYGRIPVIKDNIWEWGPYKYRHFGYHIRDWGFPMAATSHIFRQEDILPSIKAEEISTPNFLERALHKNIPHRSLMMCFDKPKFINNLANQVQTDFPTWNFGVSVKELEERFLKGEKLSLEDIKEKATKATCCRLMTNYVWE